MAAPTVFASAVSNPGGTGSTLTVTLSTHAVDDILVIYVAKTGNAAWTVPAGWTLLDQRSVGTATNGITGTWFYRKVLSGDTIPLTNPVCSLGATVTRAAICRTIRGADLEGPFVQPIYGARGFATGTSNPVRPPAVTTPAPDCLVLHCYGQRAATNAPEPTNYTQDQEVVISGTLVLNASQRTVADQATALSNQDASPTSGARWAAGILCIPSPDYPYYRSGSQATATSTSVTAALPAGTTATNVRGHKDLIIATVEAAGTAPSANTPADWTEITEWSTTTSGGATTVKKYWALYDGTINLQFNRTGSGEISVCLTTYYNAHQTTPIGAKDADPRASSTTSTWDAVTRTYTKVTMQATCVADGTPTYTSPAGYTERMDGLGISCSDQIFNAPSSTAVASFTLSAASPTLVGLVELIGVASVGAVDLVIQNASHTHTSETPALTQVHELGVAGASHAHIANGDLALTQDHSLSVQDSAHTHSAENATLTQVHTLVVQDAGHAHTSENVTLTDSAFSGFSAPFPLLLGRMGVQSTVNLVIQNGAHSHTAETPALTQTHELAIASADHSHTAGSLSLTQAHVLAVANGSHIHSVDSVVLTQAHVLVVDNTSHGHTAGNVALEQANNLSVQDASHGHVVENVTLTQTHGLTVADASHGHVAESPSLAQVHVLTIQSGDHTHTAENVTLATEGTLGIGSATHGHVAESLTLTQTHEVAVNNSSHTHSADNLTLTEVYNLSIQSAVHLHSAENLAITQSHSLTVSSTVHGHLAQNVTLSFGNDLLIANSVHGHTATNISFVPPRLSGIFKISSEFRVTNVAVDSRVFEVGSDDRTLKA